MSLLQKWKRFVGLGVLWIVILFPIPILPLFDISIPPESIQGIIIIMIIISIPLVLLAVFMK